MEKYDKKFYDYLVLNQHNYNDLAVNNDSRTTGDNIGF